MIGKPYSGKPNVRFDEGELEIEPFGNYASSLLYCNKVQPHLYFKINYCFPFTYFNKKTGLLIYSTLNYFIVAM
jgi:hypothetical protein